MGTSIPMTSCGTFSARPPMVYTYKAHCVTISAFILAHPCARTLNIHPGACDIHERGLIHRDIKPANVLLKIDSSGHAQATVMKLKSTMYFKFSFSDHNYPYRYDSNYRSVYSKLGDLGLAKFTEPGKTAGQLEEERKSLLDEDEEKKDEPAIQTG